MMNRSQLQTNQLHDINWSALDHASQLMSCTCNYYTVCAQCEGRAMIGLVWWRTCTHVPKSFCFQVVKTILLHYVHRDSSDDWVVVIQQWQRSVLTWRFTSTHTLHLNESDVQAGKLEWFITSPLYGWGNNKDYSRQTGGGDIYMYSAWGCLERYNGCSKYM